MDRESQHDRVPSKEELVRIFEIWNAAHSLHTHSYLEALFNERMNDLGKVKRFAEVLFRFCEKFHDCLFALGLNARADDAIRASIVDNLYDEFGAGDRSRAHLELMRKFMRSIGYTNAGLEEIELNPGAQKFMDEILRLCRDEHPLKGIGAICIGAECNGSEYFRRIHDAFQKKPCLDGADLYILEIHAGDDIEHRRRMLQLVQPYLDDQESRRLLRDGYFESLRLFDQLWTSMAFYETAIEPTA